MAAPQVKLDKNGKATVNPLNQGGFIGAMGAAASAAGDVLGTASKVAGAVGAAGGKVIGAIEQGVGGVLFGDSPPQFKFPSAATPNPPKPVYGPALPTPLSATPYGPAVPPPLPDPNARQAELHAIISGAAVKDTAILDQPGKLRELAGGTAAPKEDIVKQGVDAGLIPPDAPKEEKDAYGEMLKQANDLVTRFSTAMEGYNQQLDSILASTDTTPEQKQLAKLNLSIAGTENDVRAEFQRAGIPASLGLVAQVVNERDKGLILQRQYLTDLIAIRDNQYDRMVKINEDAANRAARQFDNAFNIQGRMIDLSEKSKDREQVLQDKQQTMAKDRVNLAISSGGLAYMDEAELSALAKGSGYSVAQLKAAQVAVKDKTKNAEERLSIAQSQLALSQERLSLQQDKAAAQTEATYKLGGPFDEVQKSLDDHKGSAGFTDTAFYAAWRSKAKDVAAFDATFGYLLNPNDSAAKSFIGVAEKKAQTAAQINQSLKNSINLPENADVKKNLIDDISTGASMSDLISAYREFDSTEISKLYDAYNKV